MPLPSNYYTILQSVQTIVQGLGLTFNAVTAKVSVKKLPANQEAAGDTLPELCVVPSETPPRTQRFSSEGQLNVVYAVQIVLIAAANRDLVTNLDVWLNWREL